MKSNGAKDISTSSDPRLVSAWNRIRQSSRRYGILKQSTGEAYLQFFYTHILMGAYFTNILRAHGLTRPGFNILTILRASEGKGCSHSEIGKLLLVSRANVTGLINCLSRQGLVERIGDKNDHRVCMVKITVKGEMLLEALLPEYHEKIEKVFSALTPAEKVLLRQMMEKILGQLKKLQKKNG